MQVQSGQFPDEFVVAVPHRWDLVRRETVRAAQPVHPRVQVEPLRLGLISGQRVPVDRPQRFSQRR